MNIPANCIVKELDGLTFIVYPERIHTNTSRRHDDGCIGKTQRIETFKNGVLVNAEMTEFWYVEGRLRHVTSRPLRSHEVAA